MDMKQLRTGGVGYIGCEGFSLCKSVYEIAVDRSYAKIAAVGKSAEPRIALKGERGLCGWVVRAERKAGRLR